MDRPDDHIDLEQAFAAAEQLPAAAQEALAAEIVERVRDLSESHLSNELLAEVRRRLAGPPRYADPATVQRFFARHGVVE